MAGQDAVAAWRGCTGSWSRSSDTTIDTLVQVVKAHGGLGVVGVFVPEDPNAPADGVKDGRIGWDYGTFFTKGQQMGAGQAPVKKYNRQLLDLILAGTATPGMIVSHEVDIGEAPDAYRKFDERDNGWTKVLQKPSA